jgi:hypothetical protein
VSLRILGVVALLWLVSAGSASAQRRVAIDRLEPAFDRHGFVGVQGTRAPGHLQVDTALWLSWTEDLLQLTGVPITVVDHRLASHLMVQLGLGGRYALALDVPVVLFQSGDPHGLDDLGALPAFAGGDPRLVFRARLLGEEAAQEAPRRAEGFGLAALASITAPIGAERGYVAEASAVASLQMVADFHVLGLGVGAMLGWRHRFQNTSILDVEFRDELTFGIGFEVPLPWGDGLSSLVEVRGWTDARAPFGDRERTGVVGDFGVRWRKGEHTLSATLGTGFTSGVGTPMLRALFGVMWSPRTRDSDGDGIPDHLDQCPHMPEDFDGFEDDDGCPEPDNDGDGIPDLDDRCPNDPEDFDGYQDDDGCPDGGPPPPRVRRPRPPRRSPPAPPPEIPAEPPPDEGAPLPTSDADPEPSAAPEGGPPEAEGGGGLGAPPVMAPVQE